MDQISNIARSATPSTGVQFRPDTYGEKGIRVFLRDVLAMANASVEGSRYIVVGVGFDANGCRHVREIPGEEFSGNPSYQSLANEYIEPPVRIQFTPVSVDGVRVGVFEIGDCQDRPYMVRADYSEHLRRGDAYKRVRNMPVKMGRRQLLKLFEQKFRDSVSTADIEVGFPGEIIHKQFSLPTCDLADLPSALASAKLHEMLDIRNQSIAKGSTTMVARLAHARLYGTEDPYVDRSPTIILQELEQLGEKYRHQDNHFLFRKNGRKLQLLVYNQGEEPVVDASLTLVLPHHPACHIADELPRRKINDIFVARTPDEIAEYPTVTAKGNAVQIMTKIGNIPVGEPVEIFATPLLMCIGNELQGRRFGMRYRLHGQNLRSPAKGRLKLVFA